VAHRGLFGDLAIGDMKTQHLDRIDRADVRKFNPDLSEDSTGFDGTW